MLCNLALLGLVMGGVSGDLVLEETAGGRFSEELLMPGQKGVRDKVAVISLRGLISSSIGGGLWVSGVKDV